MIDIYSPTVPDERPLLAADIAEIYGVAVGSVPFCDAARTPSAVPAIPSPKPLPATPFDANSPIATSRCGWEL